jgi:DNA-directed RNA polymerase specialized sigma24 family protein
MQQQILADYDYIKQDDFMGLYNKHMKYIKHYQRAITKSTKVLDNKDDIKQDIIVELLELFKWINKKKINKNFDFKYFAFQKMNAYRKSKKVRDTIKYSDCCSLDKISINDVIDKSTYLNENQTYHNLTGLKPILKSKENTEDHYFIYDDFPSTLSDIDKQIYFKKFVNKDKTKNICQELKMSYAILTRHIADIENKLRCYIK